MWAIMVVGSVIAVAISLAAVGAAVAYVLRLGPPEPIREQEEDVRPIRA